MANGTRVAEGNTIPHTPGSALTAGDVVVQSNLVGVADVDIAAGELGALSVSGIYQLPRIASVITALPIGTLLYWNIASQEVRATAGGGFYIGKSIEVSPKITSTILVRLSQ